MNFLVQLRRAIRKFILDVFDKLLHLALHIFQTLPHVQNDFDTRQIHAEIARQIQNQFQPLKVFLCI